MAGEPSSIRQYYSDLLPEFLQSEEGRAFMEALFDPADALGEKARAIIRSRFATEAHDTVLALMGLERSLTRMLGESSTSYANRIEGAWDSFPWAGTPYGLLSTLAQAGYPTARLVIARGEAYALNAAGTDVDLLPLRSGNWAMEPEPRPFWSSFQLIFHWAHGLPAGWVGTGQAAKYGYAPGSTGDGITLTGSILQAQCPNLTVRINLYPSGPNWRYTLDGINYVVAPIPYGITSELSAADGTSTGLYASVSSFGVPRSWTLPMTPTGESVLSYNTPALPAANSEEVDRLRLLVRKWKPAWATFLGIVVVARGDTWGWRPGTWGDGSAWGGEYDESPFGPSAFAPAALVPTTPTAPPPGAPRFYSDYVVCYAP